MKAAQGSGVLERRLKYVVIDGSSGVMDIWIIVYSEKREMGAGSDCGRDSGDDHEGPFPETVGTTLSRQFRVFFLELIAAVGTDDEDVVLWLFQ